MKQKKCTPSWAVTLGTLWRIFVSELMTAPLRHAGCDVEVSLNRVSEYTGRRVELDC